MSAVQQPCVGPLYTNFLQSIPVLIPEWDTVVFERPSVHLGKTSQVNDTG